MCGKGCQNDVLVGKILFPGFGRAESVHGTGVDTRAIRIFVYWQSTSFKIDKLGDALNNLIAEETPGHAPIEGLLERVRRETSGLHQDVEAATKLPGSVVTREDYVHLVRGLYGIHIAVEERLADPLLAQGWLEIGITLPAHRRSHLLSEDLDALGASPEEAAVQLTQLTGIGEALGCLYVVEGSALGGRVLAPAFRAVLGDVPTRFFGSDGRMHPHPWRSVLAALEAFEAAGGNAEDVVVGAQETFLAFGNRLAPKGSVRAGAQ